MKKFKQSYPRRGRMLATPFTPLSDEDFRVLVAGGLAVPGQQGASLYVAKWRDGPGVDADVFLKALHAQGSSLEVRTYRSDVNVRVVRTTPSKRGDPPLPVARSPRTG
ncbi:MAG TPA: hypothetical protein VML94_08345 [Thermoplasmata archaeon]|nr:hypothetical protein [Thermoplasmata archaeon]